MATHSPRRLRPAGFFVGGQRGVGATVAVPKVEILRLHEGASAAAATIKQQLAALEAIGVSVIVGANGPSADDLNDYIHAVASFGEIGQLMRSSHHLYIGKIDVPVCK